MSRKRRVSIKGGIKGKHKRTSKLRAESICKNHKNKKFGSSLIHYNFKFQNGKYKMIKMQLIYIKIIEYKPFNFPKRL